MGKVNSVENATLAEKSVGTGPRSARRKKGICKEVALLIAVKEAILEMGAVERLAIFVESRDIMNPILQKDSP